jgi:hypothetical protein
MDHYDIETAYEPFVSELRAEGFATPAEGWCAEMVAAHVAVNNELIATAAELVIAGQHPYYDNETAVDDTKLRAFVDSVKDISGLATAAEVSAQRLTAAAEALDENSLEYALPVRIVEASGVVHNGPIPFGEFVNGNATFHLERHLEQLKALRS